MLNNLYEQLIEESVMLYFYGEPIKDDEGNYVDLRVKGANARFKEFFKATTEEMSNLIISEFIDEERLEVLKESLEHAKKYKKASINSFVIRENTYFKIELYLENEVVIIKMNPIKYSEFKFQPYLKKAPFIAWLKSEDGVYLDINDKCEEEFNVKCEDIVGKTDYEIFKKEWADIFREEDKKVLKDNKMHIFYFQNMLLSQNDKGNDKYYSSRKWTHKTEDGSIIGIMGTAIDYTNETNILKKMKENEGVFNQIANSINDVIVIRDEKKFHYISPKFEAIFGMNPNDIHLYENIKYIDDYFEKFNKEEYEIPDTLYSYEKLSEGVIKHKTKDGKERWTLVKYSPIYNDNGDVVKKVGIYTDITKFMMLEREVENLRMDFLTNLSHELRTPINLILSSLQVIDLKLDKLNNEEQEYFNQYLGIVKQNGLRLLKLVNNLIDTTKIDSGKFCHNPKNQDIIKCVEDICMSVSQFVESNGMNIIFDTDEEEKIICFDQDNIERIVLNLLSNAIKFNKKNGNIYVTINCEDGVNISVRDTGIGIPNDKLDKVFKRFEQANGNTKIEKAGSGIGLSLVKSLVNIHGGDVKVKSELGKGTEFIISLPDKLLDEEIEIMIEEEDNYTGFNNISNLNIEFSDIYS